MFCKYQKTIEKFSHLATKTRSEKEGSSDDGKPTNQPASEFKSLCRSLKKYNFIVNSVIVETLVVISKQSHLQKCLLVCHVLVNLN